MKTFQKTRRPLLVLPNIVLALLLQSGCADTTVRYDSPTDQDLSMDSPRVEKLRELARQTATDGHRVIAEGRRELAAAREKLVSGEQMLAKGQRRYERAGTDLSAQMLQDAADQIRAGNEMVAINRRGIEAAQNKIRQGRAQLEAAAELLRILDKDEGD